MILTVTPNPTIDRAFFLRHFRLGAILRAEREVAAPSGKGVDVSLIVQRLGGETRALGLTAGHTGRIHRAMLDDEGLPHHFVEALGETRTAVLLVDQAAGQQSTVTAPTLRADESHLAQLLALLARYAAGAWGVACAGSLAAGLPQDSYARLLDRARSLGLFTLLDTSGPALVQGIAGLPHILKVNEVELAALDPGTAPLVEGRAWAGLAARLGERLGRWATHGIVVTLGPDGALAVTRAGTFHAWPPPVRVVNTAGAGDAVSGGLLLALSRGQSWPEALRLAMAAAGATVMSETIAFQERAQVEALLSQVAVDALGGQAG